MNTLKKPILVYAGENDTGTGERYEAIRELIIKELGTPYTHGHGGSEVFCAAVRAERWCEAHGLRVKDRAGMYLVDTSSKERLPAKYSHQRLVTMMQLVRKARGWYLVDVGKDVLWPNQTGSTTYRLTPAQDARVKEWLRRQYCVQAEKRGE